VTRAVAIANEIRQAIEAFRFIWQDKSFVIGVSIGLVPISADSESLAQLLGAADAACYTAKEKGRNRVQVYAASDSDLALRQGEMQWLPRINLALEQNRFLLYYQKITHVRGTDRAADLQYEVLLRMLDEQGKIVSPQAFIPAAERYNLMPSIDRWVVRSTLAWLAAHAASLHGVSTVYINLSGQSLNDETFVPFVVEQFKSVGALSVRIGFEITETAAIANLSRAMQFMNTLKALGCSFALDDFGSGMSSFAYLKNLPVDKIKIDGIFVRDILSDKIDCAMVEAINRIGHVMGIETVAEFVENDAILQKLKQIGVDYAQGYGLHMPAALSETEAARGARASTAGHGHEAH
jgi:EAL domain-containing protein (putative c-di-GMP-specific phosphodiesterase class I)